MLCVLGPMAPEKKGDRPPALKGFAGLGFCIEDNTHCKFFVSSVSDCVYENISRPRRLWPPSCGVRLPARRADPGWRWVSAHVCAHVIAMHSLDSKFPSGGKWQESSPLMALNPQLNPQLNIKQLGAR